MNEDITERTKIVAKFLGYSILASGRQVEREQFKSEATAWTFALGQIPTQHLEECFKRAISGWMSEYMMPAAAVNKAYHEMIPELQERAEVHGGMQEFLLRTGYGSMGYMTLIEWKERHNLPAAWKLGDPYPPESDLYGKSLPSRQPENYRCSKCKDAGWLVQPYDTVAAYGPTLMRCSCGQ